VKAEAVDQIMRSQHLASVFQVIGEEQVVVGKISDIWCVSTQQFFVSVRFAGARGLGTIYERNLFVISAEIGHDVPGVITYSIADYDKLERLQCLGQNAVYCIG
jgi:hypothetical protein